MAPDCSHGVLRAGRWPLAAPLGCSELGGGFIPACSPGVLRAGRCPQTTVLGSEDMLVEGSSGGQHEGNTCVVCKALNSGKMAGRGSRSQAQRHMPLISTLRRQRQEDPEFRSILSKALLQKRYMGAAEAKAATEHPIPHIPPLTSRLASSTDINECLQLPPPCAYQCHNLQGSYRCLCPPGQILLRDDRTCAPLERGNQNITTVSLRSPFVSWLRSRIPRPSGSYHAWVSLRPGSGALSSVGRAWCPAGFIRQNGVCTGKVGLGS